MQLTQLPALVDARLNMEKIGKSTAPLSSTSSFLESTRQNPEVYSLLYKILLAILFLNGIRPNFGEIVRPLVL